MTMIYMLYHSIEDRDDADKLIGVFLSEKDAQIALDLVKNQPGFRDHPDGFLIDLCRVNRISWEEGFGIDDDEE